MTAVAIERIHGPFEEAKIDLELRGAHRPYVVTDRAGRWWVLKPLQPRGILGESVGILLGRSIGVPVPEPAVFDEDDLGRGWLSSFIRGAQHWDRRRFDALDDPECLGRMLALDAIIHNEDRNTENMVFESRPRGSRYRTWVIDMESAHVSMPRTLVAMGTDAPSPHALPPDLTLTSRVRQGARQGAIAASTLGAGHIGAIVEVATETAGVLDRELLERALLLRCRQAREIVEQYLDRIATR